ncbi:MAG: xanthine dehydrogenase family protein molybdopterin-binding subunit [Candidatus Obscuribacterales bacterium]|nr:xanthine dehydrogenase family protein molybdopterin-binding subunit [Candidatus Obscuribacterales bacterium]
MSEGEKKAAGKGTLTESKKTKTIKVPIGIFGVNIAEVEREVPLDEPPPLPVNAELNVLGKPTKRLDGHLKVTGAARYTADIQLSGMLYGRILRSPHPHAKIKSIDLSQACKQPGVRAAHIITRVVGTAKERDEKTRAIDAKILFDSSTGVPIVKYVGQPVAAIAATTDRAAAEALEYIKVEYEPLPFVVDMYDAMKPDAPKVFQGPTEQEGTAGGGGAPPGLPQKGNVRGPEVAGLLGGDRGDVKAGFAEADLVVENEYHTQIQMHSALEPHGLIADWRDDALTIYASTQGTSSLRDDIAHLFNLPKNKVRVITEFMGGGFGAKFGAGNYGIAAILLSKQAKAPVKLMHDRKEEQTCAGFRPASVQNLKIGAKNDGTLTAITLSSHGTAGTALGAGVGWAAQNLYKCANFSSQHFDVLTNQSPGCAFRAPGQPQGCFAIEQAIDELCDRLGLDPLELRDKIDADEMRKQQRNLGAKAFDWSKRKRAGSDKGAIRRGVGMAQGEWPRFVDMNSSCELRLTNDGGVEVLSSVQDIGTGIRTVLAQVVAEELGLLPTDIVVRIGDTVFPTGPASGGSVTTGSITPAVRKAAHHLKLKIFDLASSKLSAEPEDLIMKDGKISEKNGGNSLTLKKLAKELPTDQLSVFASRTADYGGFEKGNFLGFGRLSSVQFAEVLVDTESGRIHIERIVAAHSCGRPLNPLALESQINGGVLQGISWALYENRHVDKASGIVVNPNVEQYKLVGAKEVPKIEIVLMEEYLGRSATDATGIGEPAIVPTAAAIANAVANAIGVRILSLPMTPDKVLAALKKGGSR